jgi:hypothetical protein
MTPEKKSESIVNLPPKIKKAIAGGIVAASLVTGCNVAVEALPHEKPIITSTSVPTKDPETNTDPTQATYELTPTQKATDTMINPPTLTPEPTATVNPDIEVVDEELAEQIKSVMPSMWVYDREQKKFVERSNEDFKFSIYKKTTLFITDGNGEEVGFARYFVKSSPDAEMTEYYSLTDISKDTVIPIKLYSQMGNYTAKVITYNGDFYTKQCMYGFVDEFTEFRLDTVFPQEAVDMYANADMEKIQKGEEIVETAILKTLANITNESIDKLYEDFQKGVLVEFNTKKGKWIVNRGINYLWSDTDKRRYEIVDGELFLLNGFSEGTQIIPDSIEGCRPMAWDTVMIKFLNENFGEDVAMTYKLNTIHFINKNTIQTPVIVDLREY